jgi:transcriptional regulator with XRE-family HTH domain
MLGVTFQQVQKYERGANRISASKLYEIAKRLGIPPGVLFDGLDKGQERSPAPEVFATFAAQPGAHELAGAFTALSPEQQRAVVNLTSVMGGARYTNSCLGDEGGLAL